MRTFFLFRSDLRILEYYHRYKDLETFEMKCHDFYLLQGIEFLRKDYFDEVVIWRLQPKIKEKNIIFNIDGKKFKQIFVDNFAECFRYKHKPSVTFFRGGFPVYCQLTNANPKFFGLKLYLGASKRFFPQYGGKYDIVLLEDERDFSDKYRCLPFYKAANPNIFKPLGIVDKMYDLCWPCNFSQVKYKGQEFFISKISASKYLRSLKIVHVGNHPEVGYELCKKYDVYNIEFKGWVDREKLNEYLNMSKFGLNLSTLRDGCPRISTEVLCSGTPLIVSDKTRLLKYYRDNVIEVNKHTIGDKVQSNLKNYDYMKNPNPYLMDIICKKNINLWA